MHDFYFYEVSTVCQTEAQSSVMVVRRNELLLFSGYKVSVVQDEEVLEICATWCLQLTRMYCTFRNLLAE